MPHALRRFGLLGDIHAEDELLAVALRYLVAQELDAVLAVGDIVDGPGSVRACCRLLVEHGVVTVRGNHERWFLSGAMRQLSDATTEVDPETRAYLASLPPTARFDTVAGPLLLCHGLDDDDMTSVGPDDFGYALATNEPLSRLMASREYALVACGHSHKAMVRRFGDVTVVNGGTLFHEHGPRFAVVDLEARCVTFLEPRADGATPVLERLPIPLGP